MMMKPAPIPTGDSTILKTLAAERERLRHAPPPGHRPARPSAVDTLVYATERPQDVVERLVAALRPVLTFADDHELVVDGDLNAWALFSPGQTRRYLLGRIWDPSLPIDRWTMINPSMAGGRESDPTITKVRGFTPPTSGGFIVGNLTSVIATDPRLLRGLLHVGRAMRPSEQLDLDALDLLLTMPGPLIAAWGRFPSVAVERTLRPVAESVRAQSPLCYGTTKGGEPRHPLMLPYSTPRRRL